MFAMWFSMAASAAGCMWLAFSGPSEASLKAAEAANAAFWNGAAK